MKKYKVGVIEKTIIYNNSNKLTTKEVPGVTLRTPIPFGYVLYRPHRGGFGESCDCTKQYTSLKKLFTELAKEFEIDVKEFSISYYCDEDRDESGIWDGPNYILCTNKAFGEDYIKKYGCPQAVGFVKFWGEE